MPESVWIIAAATLLGPILAVQAQKLIEKARERRNRKEALFQLLMATRAYRISMEHVRALNMIEITFFGSRLIGMHFRTARERAVIQSWKNYRTQLYSLPENADQPATQQWEQISAGLFVDLLHAMARDLSYNFDREQLRQGAYVPRAHLWAEQENAVARKLHIRNLMRALAADQAGLTESDTVTRAPAESKPQGKGEDC